MSRRVILASQSQSRRAVLAAAGVEAETMPSYLDEEGVKAAMRADQMSVRDQAMQLAELKAVKISQREDALVIGCDQMLSLDGIASGLLSVAIRVNPRQACCWRRSSRVSPTAVVSSPSVSPSHTRSLGLWISALANSTRLRCPSERLRGSSPSRPSSCS